MRNGASGRETLTDLDLSVPGGYKVALVGRSGAGKNNFGELDSAFLRR